MLKREKLSFQCFWNWKQILMSFWFVVRRLHFYILFIYNFNIKLKLRHSFHWLSLINSRLLNQKEAEKWICISRCFLMDRIFIKMLNIIIIAILSPPDATCVDDRLVINSNIWLPTLQVHFLKVLTNHANLQSVDKVKQNVRTALKNL